MPRLNLFEQNASNIYIGPISDSDLPAYELEVRRIWNSLPLEIAKYYTLLDAYTLEDEFYIALRSVAAERIFGRGIERVGDLIAMSADEVRERASLNPVELRKLTAVLARMGLAFNSDVEQWRAYRKTVDPDFRLMVPYGMRLPQDTGRPFDI